MKIIFSMVLVTVNSLGIISHCYGYTLFVDKMNYQEGKELCEKNEQPLAIIKSNDDLDEVGTYLSGLPFTAAYIGLWWDEATEQHKWVDDEPLTWSNWKSDKGEPDCLSDSSSCPVPDRQHCVKMINTLQFRTANCANNFSILCGTGSPRTSTTIQATSIKLSNTLPSKNIITPSSSSSASATKTTSTKLETADEVTTPAITSPTTKPDNTTMPTITALRTLASPTSEVSTEHTVSTSTITIKHTSLSPNVTTIPSTITTNPTPLSSTVQTIPSEVSSSIALSDSSTMTTSTTGDFVSTIITAFKSSTPSTSDSKATSPSSNTINTPSQNVIVDTPFTTPTIATLHTSTINTPSEIPTVATIPTTIINTLSTTPTVTEMFTTITNTHSTTTVATLPTTILSTPSIFPTVATLPTTIISTPSTSPTVATLPTTIINTPFTTTVATLTTTKINTHSINITHTLTMPPTNIMSTQSTLAITTPSIIDMIAPTTTTLSNTPSTEILTIYSSNEPVTSSITYTNTVTDISNTPPTTDKSTFTTFSTTESSIHETASIPIDETTSFTSGESFQSHQGSSNCQQVVAGLNCMCPSNTVGPNKWIFLNNLNLTFEELKAIVIADFEENIKPKISVETKQLSQYTRRKQSAVDNRPSSSSIGGLTMLLVSIPFVIIVLLDGISLWRSRKSLFLFSLFCNRKDVVEK